MTVVGFTGTRENLTDHQLSWLYTTLESRSIDIVHHGACVGADTAVHLAALDSGVPVHVWPPTNMKLIGRDCFQPNVLVTIHPRMPYLNRNREIVNATVGLIALPKHDKQPVDASQWGGTWYTVEFAQRNDRPVMICYPNGRIEHRLNTIGTPLL